jgi:hypothetical protein
MKPAKEHGVLWGEDAWWKASKIIKARMPEVFEELKEVNARLYSTPGEWQRIDAFLNQYPIHLHQEAARVRSLLMLLDCLFDRP